MNDPFAPTLIDVSSLPALSPQVRRVYAVGDVHGRLDLLLRMEALIRADLGRFPVDTALVCCLGDLVDRGPDSAGVVEHMSRPPADGLRRRCLRGNHEQRMLDFLRAPVRYGPGWLTYGGREALRSYGVEVPAEVEPDQLVDAAGALRARLPAHHLRYLRELPVGLRWGRYLFVHAGLNPDCPLDAQPYDDLLWVREPFLECRRDWGYTVVHGHVVHPEPQLMPNRIGLDTGAFWSGRLSAAALEGSGVRLLQT